PLEHSPDFGDDLGGRGSVPIEGQDDLIPRNANLNQRRKIERRRQRFAHPGRKRRALCRAGVIDHHPPRVDLAGETTVASVFQVDGHGGCWLVACKSAADVASDASGSPPGGGTTSGTA